MKAIRVRNLRSFADTEGDLEPPYVELRPLSILVGKNSCGKSTLLRTLPIIKQSSSSKVTAPILWFGDFSDFGSFSTALHRNSTNKKIYFDYKFDIKMKSNNIFEDLNGTKSKNDSFEVEFKQGLCEKEGQTFVKTITLNIESSKLKVERNDDETYDISLNNSLILKNKELLPFKSNLTLDLIDKEALSENSFFGIDHHITELMKSYIEKLRVLTTKRVSENKIRNAITNLGLCSLEYFKTNSLEELYEMKTFSDKWNTLAEDDIYSLYEMHLVTFLPQILSYSSSSLESFANGIKYIGPVRANGNRFSRQQEFNINEIDPTGINIPAFLNRLSEAESTQLAEWTKENFDFTVRTLSDGLHNEVMIRYLDEDEENITDMGSGFSQILPIVISLWNETERRHEDFRRRNESIVFAIEQPELHLHPEYQALFIRTIMRIIKRSKRLKIVLETHSKTIIDTIADSIEDKLFNSNDVEISIFNKKNKITTIEKAKYNQDGSLVNWPIGFLSGR